jgi:predicted GNAT family N-acyltransferase
VVEQHVPYQNELDQEDQCTHIVAYLPPAAASPSLPAAITEAQTPAPTASATAGPDLVPAGTIRILLKGPQKAKLQRLAVLSEFRKQQVATALMNYAENLLHDIGVRETYLDGQSYIKDFYLRLGYQTDGLEFEEEKIMHFLFTKQLAASN